MSAAFAPTVASNFEISVSRSDDVLIVTIRGALDFCSATEARRLLLDQFESQPKGLIIDTRDAFVDSSGIGVLVLVAQRARQERRLFRLVCRERLAAVLRLLAVSELLGLDQAAGAQARGPQIQRAA